MNRSLLFLLIATCAVQLFAGDEKGSKEDLKKFAATGACRGCNLRGFELEKVIKRLNEKGKKINLESADLRLVNLIGINSNRG